MLRAAEKQNGRKTDDHLSRTEFDGFKNPPATHTTKMNKILKYLDKNSSLENTDRADKH